MAEGLHIKRDPWDMLAPVTLDKTAFADQPLFTPDLSPQRLLELGIFDGYYFRGDVRLVADLPQEWFPNARWADRPMASLNYFGVSSAAPYEAWASRGDIQNVDPLGWFQWYCRFYAGRRNSTADPINIRRWANARSKISRAVVSEARGPSDLLARRQELLHWACDPYPDKPVKTEGGK